MRNGCTGSGHDRGGTRMQNNCKNLVYQIAGKNQMKLVYLNI